MAIKPEEALSVFGIDKLESFEKVEDFKKEVDKSWIKRDQAHLDEGIVSKASGKMLGTVEGAVKRVFKDAGIEFDPGDIGANGEKKKLEDIAQAGLTKLLKKHSEELESIKAAGGGDHVKEVEKWQKKHAKLEEDLKQERSMREKAASDLETTKGGFDSERKNWSISQKQKELFGQMKYKGGLPPEVLSMTKTGFEAEFSKRYKLDLDEKGELELRDSEGKKVPDPKKSGEFLSPIEGMKNLAIDQKIWETNPHNGKQAQRSAVNGGQASEDTKPKRPLHPSFGAMGIG